MAATLLWDRVVYATLPVLKICLLSCVGALLSHAGILDQAGRRVLSRLIYTLFTPCLTFGKLAPVLTVSRLLQCLPIMLNMFTSVAAGLALGVALMWALRPPAALRRHVVVAAGLGNAGNLPLVLVAALVRESGGKLFAGQAVGEDLAIAYVAIGIWAATLTHFTIGSHLLRLPDVQRAQQDTHAQLQHADGSARNGGGGGDEPAGACAVLELGSLTAGGGGGQRQQQQQQSDMGLAHHRGAVSDSRASMLSSSSTADCVVLAAEVSAHKADDCDGGPDATPSMGEHTQLLGQRQEQQQRRRRHSQHSQHSSAASSSRLAAVGPVACELLQQLGSPPMVGCWAAAAVGMATPLRDQLFEPEGGLRIVQDCIDMFGACCIPCLLLMLGATLARGPGKARVPVRVIAGVAAARLVLLPLLGTGWLLAARAVGCLPAPDKMFLLVMLLQNAVPTALNVHTLATLHGNKEAEMGALLFWQYLAACLALPAALSAYLWLLSKPIMDT